MSVSRQAAWPGGQSRRLLPAAVSKQLLERDPVHLRVSDAEALGHVFEGLPILRGDFHAALPLASRSGPSGFLLRPGFSWRRTLRGRMGPHWVPICPHSVLPGTQWFPVALALSPAGALFPSSGATLGPTGALSVPIGVRWGPTARISIGSLVGGPPRLFLSLIGIPARISGDWSVAVAVDRRHIWAES